MRVAANVRQHIDRQTHIDEMPNAQVKITILILVWFNRLITLPYNISQMILQKNLNTRHIGKDNFFSMGFE